MTDLEEQEKIFKLASKCTLYQFILEQHAATLRVVLCHLKDAQGDGVHRAKKLIEHMLDEGPI